MSVNRIALGKRISFYRLKFSMTQEKLADLTNCSREYIAYLENGVKTPSLPILVDLANALHISVDALLVDSLDYQRTALIIKPAHTIPIWLNFSSGFMLLIKKVKCN